MEESHDVKIMRETQKKQLEERLAAATTVKDRETYKALLLMHEGFENWFAQAVENDVEPDEQIEAFTQAVACLSVSIIATLTARSKAGFEQQVFHGSTNYYLRKMVEAHTLQWTFYKSGDMELIGVATIKDNQWQLADMLSEGLKNGAPT